MAERFMLPEWRRCVRSAAIIIDSPAEAMCVTGRGCNACIAVLMTGRFLSFEKFIAAISSLTIVYL